MRSRRRDRRGRRPEGEDCGRDHVLAFGLVLLFFARHTLFPTRRRPRSIRALSSTLRTTRDRPLSFIAHKTTILRVCPARSSAPRPPRPRTRLSAHRQRRRRGDPDRARRRWQHLWQPLKSVRRLLGVHVLGASRPRWLQQRDAADRRQLLVRPDQHARKQRCSSATCARHLASVNVRALPVLHACRR
jgi:hypothetical protein